MSIEQKINSTLQKAPWIKKIVKRCYQLLMVSISPKKKVEGNVRRITPIDDEYEYFFGYYDKSPWDKTERYMLALRTASTTINAAPKEQADVVLIDTKKNNIIKVSETKAWNVQQGAMLQWLGPDFSSEILFNDYREGEYVTVKLDIHTKKETIFHFPVYSVSQDGAFALSLDFSRLHRLRPGYGYAWIEDKTKEEAIPDEPAIWKIDLIDGKILPLLTYTDLYNFETREEMIGAEHKVNHIMINPSGTRFMVLHRWIKGAQRYSRLLTIDCDGSNIYNLSDDNMASHSYWKNNHEIISYLRKEEEGNGYFLLKDLSKKYTSVLKDIDFAGDGHPSFSEDGTKLITDTYPNRQRIQTVYLTDATTLSNAEEIAQVYAPFKYDNDVRCDLHPRWDRKSEKVAIDATFEGKRALYVVNF